MNALWLLLVFACPLMMIVMMRGMGGMGGGGQHHDNDHASDHTAESAGSTTDRDARIAELEREVAELRTARRDGTDDTSASRR